MFSNIITWFSNLHIYFHLLNPATAIGFSGLYLILLVATIVVFFYREKMSTQTRTELNSRIKTWFVIITGFMVTLSFNRYISMITFCIISALAFREYVASINIRPADRKVVKFAYLMIPVQYLWIALDWYGMAIVFIPIYMFLTIPLFLILSKEANGFLKSVGTIYWGMMAAVFCLSHVALLLTLPVTQNVVFNSTSLVFFLLFLTEFNDVLQYLWGKLLGRKKIIPSISPNKTCAGFFGGVLSTSLIAYLIAPYFTPFTGLQALFIGLVIGIAGFIGDVCMSAIKRDIGVKDYSSFLPGHGGVLDRLDSLIYTAPLFFHYIHYLYY